MMKNKYKVLITSCWVLLTVCLAIKLFGAELFTIVCENEKFIRFCDYLDNNVVPKYIFATILYIPSTYLIYLSMVKKKIGEDWWLCLIALPCSVCKGYVPILGTVLELSITILIPLLRTKFKVWRRIIVGLVLIFGFQIISLVTKDIGGLYLNDDSMLICSILLIDYYIMVGLYYLYSNRKEIK